MLHKKIKYSKKILWVIVLLLIVISGLYFLISLLPLVSNISEKIQTAANIFIIISALFVGMQLLFYTLEFNDNNKRQKIEKSIQMAEIFAKEIIPSISYLYEVYKEIGITKIMSDIKDSDIKEFDMVEMEKIIVPSKQEIIEKNLKNIDPKILILARRALFRNINIDYSNYIACFAMPNLSDDKDINQKLVSNILNTEFMNIRNDTLNKLEYICMYFNAGIANDRVIYQSIHQAFLLNTKILYYDICKYNTDGGKSKYYTNIIALYKTWNAQKQKVIEKEAKIIRNQTQKNVSM